MLQFLNLRTKIYFMDIQTFSTFFSSILCDHTDNAIIQLITDNVINRSMLSIDQVPSTYQ